MAPLIVEQIKTMPLHLVQNGFLLKTSAYRDSLRYPTGGLASGLGVYLPLELCGSLLPCQVSCCAALGQENHVWMHTLPHHVLLPGVAPAICIGAARLAARW